MYNPWTISYYLETRETRGDWVNTSSDDMVTDLFIEASPSAKDDLNKLLDGKSIHKCFVEEVNFRDIYDDEGTMCGLLFASGY